MKVIIDRQGWCMADDASDHRKQLDILDIMELQDYLRDYLTPVCPQSCVWAIYRISHLGEKSILSYFYISNKVSYFVDSEDSQGVHDKDFIYCRLFTENDINSSDKFPQMGSLLYRVQLYMELNQEDSFL